MDCPGLGDDSKLKALTFFEKKLVRNWPYCR